MHFYEFFRKFYDLYSIYGDVKGNNKAIVENQINDLLQNTDIDYTDVPKEVKESALKLMDYHKEIEEKKDTAVLVRLEPLIKEEIKKIEMIMEQG